MLLQTTIAFLVITIITTSLRLYVRIVVVQAPGWDDAVLGISLVSCDVLPSQTTKLILFQGFFIAFAVFVIRIVNMENDQATSEQGILKLLNKAYLVSVEVYG